MRAAARARACRYAAAVLPPLAVAVVDPDLFLGALEVAGLFGVLVRTTLHGVAQIILVAKC